MSKHTPGPWYWVKKCDYWVLESATGEKVADDGTSGNEYSGWFHSEDGRPCANAHLIAAAPELLKSLESLMDSVIYTEPCDETSLAMEQARATIAKVRGKL